MVPAHRETSRTSIEVGSLHRAQHSTPLRGERSGCGEGLWSSVRGRSSACAAIRLPGGGALPLSSLAANSRPSGTARPDSEKRPPRARNRRRASPNPWRTDSTRAVTRASPRTEQDARAGVRDPEAATERETRKRHAPESRPELATLHGDHQRPGECGPGEHRSGAELPLRADEQPTQPRRCDPRKHLDGPSKARACRKHRRSRARSRAHAGVRRREGGGPAAASADNPSATPVARSLTLG